MIARSEYFSSSWTKVLRFEGFLKFLNLHICKSEIKVYHKQIERGLKHFRFTKTKKSSSLTLS